MSCALVTDVELQNNPIPQYLVSKDLYIYVHKTVLVVVVF